MTAPFFIVDAAVSLALSVSKLPNIPMVMPVPILRSCVSSLRSRSCLRLSKYPCTPTKGIGTLGRPICRKGANNEDLGSVTFLKLGIA